MDPKDIIDETGYGLWVKSKRGDDWIVVGMGEGNTTRSLSVSEEAVRREALEHVSEYLREWLREHNITESPYCAHVIKEGRTEWN